MVELDQNWVGRAQLRIFLAPSAQRAPPKADLVVKNTTLSARSGTAILPGPFVLLRGRSRIIGRMWTLGGDIVTSWVSLCRFGRTLILSMPCARTNLAIALPGLQAPLTYIPRSYCDGSALFSVVTCQSYNVLVYNRWGGRWRWRRLTRSTTALCRVGLWACVSKAFHKYPS